MSKRTYLLPLASAIASVVFSAGVMANEAAPETITVKPTDVLTDGWTVNGYVRTA